MDNDLVKSMQDIAALQTDNRNTKEILKSLTEKIEAIPERVINRLADKFKGMDEKIAELKKLYYDLHMDHKDNIKNLEQRINKLEKFKDRIGNYWHVILIIISVAIFLLDKVLNFLFPWRCLYYKYLYFRIVTGRWLAPKSLC